VRQVTLLPKSGVGARPVLRAVLNSGRDYAGSAGLSVTRHALTACWTPFGNSILDMESVVINNRLEEFLEKLLRWDELCQELKELYYRYLDLAAFRSEKCYFPGRKCVRSWEREYDVGDLTLMWTYILNTAPLCGKLIRALAEVEYEIRKRALESLEKYGGAEKRVKTDNNGELVRIRLENPVSAYLLLEDGEMYVVWSEFDGLPRNGKARASEIERKVVDVVERYRRSRKLDVQLYKYEVDGEYKRLWIEVPLSKSVSELFGKRNGAPIAVFRNLGWLLSDDYRRVLKHCTSNPGQMSVRLFDWIAIAKYAIEVLKVAKNKPLVAKLAVHYINETLNGANPVIEVRLIGAMAKVVLAAYSRFGITLGEPDDVLIRGHTVLKALRSEAFKKEGRTYVVDDVGAWIAFSNVVNTLVIGDGFVTLYKVGIAEGKFTKELAEALGGTVSSGAVSLQSWHLRLLLPAPPTPVAAKSAKLYEVIVSYPAMAVVEIRGVKYLFTHNGDGKYVIGRGKAGMLYETVRQLGLKMGVKGAVYVMTHAQLMKLAARGVPVRLLNDLEKDAIREVRPLLLPDPEVVRRILEEVAKMARITESANGRRRVRIVPYDRSRLEEIATLLKSVGMRFSVDRRKGRIIIYERRLIEMIREIMQRLQTSS